MNAGSPDILPKIGFESLCYAARSLIKDGQIWLHAVSLPFDVGGCPAGLRYPTAPCAATKLTFSAVNRNGEVIIPIKPGLRRDLALARRSVRDFATASGAQYRRSAGSHRQGGEPVEE
jgi:hypothetical protein